MVGVVVWAVACAACGSSESDPKGVDSGVPQRSRIPAPIRPAASCEVVIDAPELLGGGHVEDGMPLTYNSNPPTSGPHYSTWANFQEFSAPFDDGYLVHSLEHGAIALLYKCEAAACAGVVDALRKVRDSLSTDPLCDPTTRVRVILAPYPKLDVPVAAVAWGWSYKAQCVDVPTLTQFAKDHYAQGPEDLCPAGRTF